MCWRDSLSNREWNLQCGGALGRYLVQRGDEYRMQRVREAIAQEKAELLSGVYSLLVTLSADRRAAHDEDLR